MPVTMGTLMPVPVVQQLFKIVNQTCPNSSTNSLFKKTLRGLHCKGHHHHQNLMYQFITRASLASYCNQKICKGVVLRQKPRFVLNGRFVVMKKQESLLIST
ncbi:uncharacterized protein LOC120170856 [Hibiscus syriacus]|uniref:uncharacterized protein LOC120170856 n=1 Tax=Hibiscus syriacus TaxID=106335 RepID=UPI0019219844|nr:uncharacterized protein LOC120170856 [Hibiscus syriacus]